MNNYTIVGIHDSGLGLIRWQVAENAQEALRMFNQRNEGVALVVFEGHLTNVAIRNLWFDSDGKGPAPDLRG